jgi:hypothetical protein
VAPFDDWNFVSGVCRKTGRQLLKLELSGQLPNELPTDFE